MRPAQINDNGIANNPYGIADSNDTGSIIPGKPETNEARDKTMYIIRKGKPPKTIEEPYVLNVVAESKTR